MRTEDVDNAKVQDAHDRKRNKKPHGKRRSRRLKRKVTY